MKGKGLDHASRMKKGVIVRRLLRWYARNGRDLPWRRTHDPYVILLSEVMLQQTQVDRVLKKLPAFRLRFPTLLSLAEGQRADVIRAWSGLGYNGRAVRLHDLARHVRRHHGGRLPRSVEGLLELPGIGRYTANAIAAFAFGQRVPVVDTNVQRVLSRLFPHESQKLDIWTLAGIMLPQRSSYAWNQGLMDLGATFCTARNPECPRCPVASQCPSAHQAGHEPKLRRKEPSRNGIPDRIYRGRIVQALRDLDGSRSTELDKLGKTIKQPFSNRDKKWLNGLLNGLERDRLARVTRRNGKVFISLPR
jgi:A/G-specific adenine glycosylase